MTFDPASMSDNDIEEYARNCVAKSGEPDGDPGPLISALKNSAPRDRALEDPYWRDLANREAQEWKDPDD